MALAKNKDITLTAFSKVGDDKKDALRMTASLSTSDTSNDAVNQYVIDSELYMAHKAEVRKDIAAFQQYVYEQEDQLATEVAEDEKTQA